MIIIILITIIYNYQALIKALSAHIHAQKERKTRERRTNNLTNKLGDGFYYRGVCTELCLSPLIRFYARKRSV